MSVKLSGCQLEGAQLEGPAEPLPQNKYEYRPINAKDISARCVCSGIVKVQNDFLLKLNALGLCNTS